MSEAKQRQSFTRFSILERIEHWVLFLSFTTLALTGLPQKYPLSPISRGLVSALGGIETIRVIHRVAATIFLIEAIYHLVIVGYKLFVRRVEPSMVPTIKDGKDAIDSFKYNLGLSKTAPKMPRYNFTEKAEYWAMIWGLLVMAVTGFMLWNPIATTNIVPGDFIPAAKVAHGGEAVLAVLAIILWHFWHVHIRLFNKAIFTGEISRHHMEEEHGAELEQIEAGRVPQPPPPAIQRRRLAIFAPIAAVVSLALLAGVYWFVTFEQSSITTLPPAQQGGEAFVPQTPTPAPATATVEAPAGGETGAVGWVDDVAVLFQTRCASCHGSMGGFNAESYEEVLGGVEPGDPDASPVVQVQVEGGHPGMFEEAELQRVIDWIAAGAPEQGGSAETGDESNPVSWTWQVQGVFQAKCASCHGSMGGFSAESYDSVMEAIQPGDPDGSEVMQVQAAGNHPGMFSDEELQLVTDWITAGAPQQ